MVESVSSCAQALTDDRAVRYLGETLSEPEREAFEVHVLECAECSDLLEAARVARDVLEEDALAARRVRRRPLLRMASLAAGLITVAAASFLLVRPRAGTLPTSTAPGVPVTSTPAVAPTLEGKGSDPEWAELGRVEPPSYVPLTLRAPRAPDAAFDRAMGHYARHEYETAAAGLREVTRERPSLGEAWFFLGVSELMAGRARDARAALAQAARLGQPPYAGAAAFFGAKADLQLGEVDPARRALREVTAGGGPYAGEARRLLERLERVETGAQR
jgi:hypothetical protein